MYQWETGSKVSSPYLKSKLMFSNSYKIKRKVIDGLVKVSYGLVLTWTPSVSTSIGPAWEQKNIIIVRYLVEQYCFTKYKMVSAGFKPAGISIGMIPIEIYHFSVSIRGFHMKKSFFIENMPLFKLQSIIFYEWIY